MNTYGRNLTVSIYGESHGKGVGCVMDGLPAGLPLHQDDFLAAMQRRQGGKKGATPRKEPDIPEILSGVFEGRTTGAPLNLFVANTNVRSRDYSHLLDMPRPGHSDWTARLKYGGYNDYRGGGHFSGRLTAALVAAGEVARKLIAPATVSAKLVEAGGSENIDEAVARALAENDSIGGVVRCEVTQVPPGLGEPFFGKAEAEISHWVFSLPAIKGLEFGDGFAAARMRGSTHNDPIVAPDGTTGSNHAGGLAGGITNNNDLRFRVAVKPTSSIGQAQRTWNFDKQEMDTLEVGGRHDACIALRVPPVLEAVSALALAGLMAQAQLIPRVWKG